MGFLKMTSKTLEQEAIPLMSFKNKFRKGGGWLSRSWRSCFSK
jgi:hypothetical protein